jgi:uncharacterized oxidoreductase
MPTITPAHLEPFVTQIFVSKGASQAVAKQVAWSLVAANLRGHDSHGVIRVIEYVDWLDRGWIDPAGEIEVTRDQGPILMIDGHDQFGQVIGRQATELAIAKAKEQGVCILTICHSAHLGRVGEFMEQAADAGIVSFSWTNTHGGGVLAAPHGGRQPRLSANPLAAGAPIPGGESVIMDIATCTVAEGKVKVARAKGEQVPPGCIIDGHGEPTTDPQKYYTEPKGAILPVAAHKGYSLALFADILAGAIAGGSCSHANVDKIANGWFAIFVDPQAFAGRAFYDEQVTSLQGWIKSCPTVKGVDEVLLPGEPEVRTQAKRSQTGIPIESGTWDKLLDIAAVYNIGEPQTLSS